ncbi:GPW/gp25 family protein [Brenneria uluponensis]|uniref:GPW/gp25 family protein n=1 Tax=Brenneria uluponensis TaxID=3057057 RepID=UPI0028ED3057|nr:GPW/gp25 family protein [Brenneria ulupoensis]
MSSAQYLGMNAQTGRAITDGDHIRQSVNDILITPLGSRVMRREYGSTLFSLIDQPFNDVLRMKITSAAYSALMRWEPRISPTRITLVVGTAGRLAVTVHAQRTDTPVSFSAEIQL